MSSSIVQRTGMTDASGVDHAVVGAAFGHGRNGWGAALLMRDISSELVAIDDRPFSPARAAAPKKAHRVA